MSVSPLQALGAINRPSASERGRELLIIGATGTLGNAVLRRLVGMHRFAHTCVLAREPMQRALRSVSLQCVQGEIAQWPRVAADVAVILFDPPRNYHEREKALYAPAPQELPVLAQWLAACGVKQLALVMPHAQGSLPEAVKAGLANLDEQQMASLGFETVLILRSAQKPASVSPGHALQRLARGMLGIMAYMVPSHEQPARPARTAELLDAALQLVQQHGITGTHVASPEVVWRASQGDQAQMRAVARQWLMPESGQHLADLQGQAT